MHSQARKPCSPANPSTQTSRRERCCSSGENSDLVERILVLPSMDKRYSLDGTPVWKRLLRGKDSTWFVIA